MFEFAHKVVHDEQRRFEPGEWVRSTIGRLSLRNQEHRLFAEGARTTEVVFAGRHLLHLLGVTASLVTTRLFQRPKYLPFAQS